MTLTGKLIGALVLLAALGGAVAWEVATIRKANERDAAVAHAAQVEREKVELAQTFAKAQADNLAIAADVKAFRTEETARAREWRIKLGASHLTKDVPRETSEDSVDPCRARDPVEYRGLFNSAVGAAYP